jgi:hypothetical protein
MKRIPVAISLLLVFSATVSASLLPLNRGHHPKKAGSASQARVEYHGSAPYSAEGRLYFPTSGRSTPPPAAQTHLKQKAQRASR